VTPERLGLFGGTFDPVHNAHLFVAEGAREELALERVVFLPGMGSRHRDAAPAASAADRVAMLRLAIADNPGFALDESDLAPEATGYTADLVPRLRARYPDTRLTFIVGGDSLIASPWQRFDDVLDGLDAFAIAPRLDRPLDPLNALLARLTPERRAKVRILALPMLGESATLVRARLAARASVRYIVPDAVRRYIELHKLYQEVSTDRRPEPSPHAG
jgi:nicotinate-nucleotide adenylyltransferase